MVDAVSNPSTLDVLSPVDVAQIFESLRDYVAVQEPVFDEFGTVVDTHLIWWNRGYEAVRVTKVNVGQSMLSTYFEPEVALEFVNKAWNSGHAFQLFELTPEKRDRYRPAGVDVLISVDWQRVGNLIVEVGSDLSEFRALQMQLADQRSLAFVANRDRALLAERERIARNLHDSVIQQIYAASLGLSAIVARRPSDASTTATLGDEETEQIRRIADRLSDLIKTIRDEIFDVAQDPSGTLQRELESVLVPLVAPTPIEMSLDISMDSIDDKLIMAHLRAVVREAVSNAVRHSHCSKITVSVHEGAQGNIEVVISDNGVGMPVTERRSGLANIDDRARELGGKATVEDTATGGTTVRWVVPLPNVPDSVRP